MWLIVADDLTGAADSALEFVKGGASAEVQLLGCSRGFAGGTDVVALTTESRALPPSAAAAKIAAVLAATLSAPEAAGARIYKKVDSTLRGSVGAEVVATMKAVSATVCIMAAASPDAGRTTIGGYQLLNGVPLENTPMANDPLAPAKSSCIKDLFAGLAVNVIEVSLKDLAAGAPAVAAVFANATKAADAGAEPTVVVCDGATQDHMEVVVDALGDLLEEDAVASSSSSSSSSLMLCGSQGLAAALANTDAVWTDAGEQWPKVQPGPVIIASTSHQKAVKAQLKKLVETHPLTKKVVASQASPAPTPTLKATGILVVSAGSAAQADFDATVAQTAAAVTDAAAAGVVLCGGGLATAVLAQLGCTALQVLQDADQNAPLCRVVGGGFNGLQVVTKAGALGSEGVLVSSVAKVRENVDLGPGIGRPILGITMGDPCGVGPEIIAKALSLPEMYKKYRPMVIGDPRFLEAGIKAIQNYGGISVRRVHSPEECTFEFGTVECYSNFDIKYDEVEVGVVGAEAGRCAAQWVIDAVELACADRIDAIVTAPLNKEAIHMGGFKYNGHTELLAKYSGAKTSRLMLVANNLKVVHATAHVAFRKVSEQLSQPGRLETTIDMLHEFMLELGYDAPKIALAGLNPHCGDGDIYGETEEKTIIEPCRDVCNAKPGYNIIGPVPGDTCFMKAVRGDFDAVVAMYHDEGHIPAKLMGFGDTVNVTLGLPIIRTSVDHGTAFDIAGQGIAHHSNLVTAMEFGSQMAIGRQQKRLLPGYESPAAQMAKKAAEASGDV